MLGLDQKQTDAILAENAPVLEEIEQRIRETPRDTWHPTAAALADEYRNTVQQGTEEWFEQRTHCVTASVVASILGIGAYANAGSAFRRKVGIDTSSFSSSITQHGHTFESVAMGKYYQHTGRIPLDDFPCIPHQTYPYFGASPDFITTCGIVGEIKCPPKRTIVPQKVPDYYMPQLQFQMEVFDLPIAHFVQYKPRVMNPVTGGVLSEEVFDITVVPRDPEWFATHLPRLQSFWRAVEQYREDGVLPPEYAPNAVVVGGKRKLSFITKEAVVDDQWDMYGRAERVPTERGRRCPNRGGGGVVDEWDMYA